VFESNQTMNFWFLLNICQTSETLFGVNSIYKDLCGSLVQHAGSGCAFLISLAFLTSLFQFVYFISTLQIKTNICSLNHPFLLIFSSTPTLNILIQSFLESKYLSETAARRVNRWDEIFFVGRIEITK